MAIIPPMATPRGDLSDEAKGSDPDRMDETIKA
jgi:hypothetical protein